MKKYFYLLGVLILFPFFVLADTAGPAVLGYDAVIINKNGAKVKESKEVIAYNTKVRVVDEFDGYGMICLTDECSRWGESSKLILISDYLPIKEEITPKDIEKKFDKDGYNSESEASFHVSNDKFIVFESKGIKLSKGPSEAYGKYEQVISYMTHLTTKCYIFTGSGETENNYWYYIDDGKYHGWLNASAYYSNLQLGQLTEKLVTMDNISLYDRNNKLVTTIPSETMLTNAYYIEKNKEYYIEYNDKDGFVKENKFVHVEKVDGFVIALKDTDIISSSKVVGTIPSGTKVNIVYGKYEQIGRDDFKIDGVEKNGKKYYYVQYKDSRGLISEDNVASFLNSDYEYYSDLFKKVTFTLNSATELYSDIYYADEPTGIIIPSGTKIISYYSYEDELQDATGIREWYNCYLVMYNNTKGWIKIKTEKGHEIEKIDPVDEMNNTNTNKTSDTLIYALVGAGICCFVGVISIIVVNKKKKKNNNTMEKSTPNQLNQEVSEMKEEKKD